MRRWGFWLALAGNLAAQGMGGGASALIWPAQGEYIGSSQCALCHPAQAKSFRVNGMHRAMAAIGDCDILQQHPRMTWSDGPYQYLIEKTEGGYRYSVANGAERADATLRYAFGQGKAGQTYVFEKDGRYYESRVSYYRELNGLSLTVGAQNARPADILQALGRLMSPNDARDCFGCHTTGARRGNALQLEKFENGVQCEDCHSPGAAHIASIVDGKPKPGTIRNLRGLSAESTNDLCGSCHRTWETIALLNIRGPNNARFQPYRLTNSRCYDPSDRRIACTACHDPHAALVTDAKAYDSKCAACHNAGNTAIGKRVCKVGGEGCVTCHMPRVEAPGSHHLFVDHWIRVARKGDAYPD